MKFERRVCLLKQLELPIVHLYPYPHLSKNAAGIFSRDSQGASPLGGGLHPKGHKEAAPPALNV